MRVTLVQNAPKLNRSNLDTVIEIVKSYIGTSDLVVFPELSLNGYSLQDKLHEDAWELHELVSLEELSKEIDIVIGAAIKEGAYFRNAALYFHTGRLLSMHKKVHLPNYGMFEEARYFKAGDVFESFYVDDKKVSMLVCEDLWHESIHKELVRENPDLIIALVASPARGFNDSGLTIEKKWYKIIQKVSFESKAELLFVNRVGFEDGLGFWGGSCIVNSSGEVVKKLPLYKTAIETFTL
ncbi:MAG: nitrilase [Campylobacterales bacterium]|nr:nitrilase [Campylobacterales bacterium]